MQTKALKDNKKYRQILSAVHMVYRLVNSTYNVKELALRLTRVLCHFIQANSASVYILDPVKQKVDLIAVFNNRINILIDKKKDLERISAKEKSVIKGKTIFEKRMMGLPLVSDDNIGAIFIQRSNHGPAFSEFDREIFSVFAEQSVTAIKNLQLYEEKQQTILGSIKFISKFVEKQGYVSSYHTPVYFKIVKSQIGR